MTTQRQSEEPSNWTNTTLPIDRIVKRLGAQHVAWIRAQGDSAAITCDGRADGAWFANDGESYCAYRSLARLLRTERFGEIFR